MCRSTSVYDPATHVCTVPCVGGQNCAACHTFMCVSVWMVKVKFFTREGAMICPNHL